MSGWFFGAVAIPAPFFAINSEDGLKVLAWVGYGIIFTLLSLVSAVAARDEK